MLKILKRIIIDWCLRSKNETVGDIYANSSPLNVEIPDHNGNLKFIGQGKSEKLVKTPRGWSVIAKTLKTIKYDVWELELENGMKLGCADEHIVITTTGEKHVNKLTAADLVLVENGVSAVKSIIKKDYSEHMYDLEIDDNEHVYYTNKILSHNTTVVAMYVVWLTCFASPNKPKLCIIASKAMNHATEIMSRIKYAYEELPAWLKPGCKYYSRTSIEFDNNAKIKCEATSEKTGRGSSPSFLFIDEIAFLSKRIQDEMWASLAPSLSTGGKFVLTSTPNGDNDLFASLWRGANSKQNSFNPIKAMWYQHPDRGEEYYKDMLGKLGPVKSRQELDCLQVETLINTSIGTMAIGDLFEYLSKGQDEVCKISD